MSVFSPQQPSCLIIVSNRAPYPAPVVPVSPMSDELTDRSVCGTLKFIADKSDATCYVSEIIGSDGACNLTTDIKKALRLRFGPQSRLYIMELMVSLARHAGIRRPPDITLRAARFPLLMVGCSLEKPRYKYWEGVSRVGDFRPLTL